MEVKQLQWEEDENELKAYVTNGLYPYYCVGYNEDLVGYYAYYAEEDGEEYFFSDELYATQDEAKVECQVHLKKFINSWLVNPTIH